MGGWPATSVSCAIVCSTLIATFVGLSNMNLSSIKDREDALSCTTIFDVL